MSASVRVTVLMTPQEKQLLEKRAKFQKMSVGEVVRLAVRITGQDLDHELHTATQQLNAANKLAREAIDVALANMETREKDWERREKDAVRKGEALALAWLTHR